MGRRLRGSEVVVLPALPRRNGEHVRVYEEDGLPQPPELAHDGPADRVDVEALQVEDPEFERTCQPILARARAQPPAVSLHHRQPARAEPP